jgi:hypothetical protein
LKPSSSVTVEINSGTTSGFQLPGKAPDLLHALPRQLASEFAVRKQLSSRFDQVRGRRSHFDVGVGAQAIAMSDCVSNVPAGAGSIRDGLRIGRRVDAPGRRPPLAPFGRHSAGCCHNPSIGQLVGALSALQSVQPRFVSLPKILNCLANEPSS